MSSVLYALGRWAFRARRLVLLIWIGVLALLVAGAGLLGTGTDNTYTIPGTESQEALDALARTFPQVSGASAQLIVVAPDGSDVDDPAIQSAVEETITAIAAIPQVSSATSPYDSATGNINPDASAALVPIQLSVGQSAVVPGTSTALQDAGAALEAALPEGSTVSVGGQLFSQTAAGIGVTELVGILIAFGVLVVAFASFVAAGLPLMTALIGVGVSLSIVLIATSFTTITSTTPLLSLMLGLAVGIDYALFIISRHQDQVKRGMPPEESAARSVATAGSAVVFAAVTVIIALLGLAVAQIPFLTTMGIAAALAVAVAVLISMTLTPALLGFAGILIVAKRYRPGGRHTDASRTSADDVANDELTEDAARQTLPEGDVEPEPRASNGTERGFFRGWVKGVTKWPIVTVAAIVVLLGLAAVPAMQLRLALPDAGSLDEHEPGRITYDLIADHFGPGYNGPLIVTGSIIQSTDPVGVMDELGERLRTVTGVAAVPLSTPNETGDTGIAQVIPEGEPDSEETAELVATLRSLHDDLQDEYGADLSVTGYTAAGIDISARLGSALLPFGLLVVGLSLVLLAMVFRSIVVPLTAALGYVLSIGAAFGITSLVFQSGFLAGPLGVASLGSVISFMPIILMGVLFGLAMDYEVFLVSRMREDYVHTGDVRHAIRSGFVASARVVTAAAIIMFSVFAAFIPEGDASIQPIALGLAVGVTIDAFIVRMSLIPAVLMLFGARAWWIPAWLDRALPSFDVEGEALHKELDLADWPEPGDRIAIAAEGVSVADHDRPLVDGFDVILPAGDILIVRGSPGSGRSALLLVLCGRVPLAGGTLKIAGFAMPMRASAVRSRAALVGLARSTDPLADLRDALAGDPSILVVDDLDAVVRSEDRSAIASALVDARREALGRGVPFTIVASCADRPAIDDMLPPGMSIHVAHLDDRARGTLTLAVIRHA